MLFHSYAFLVLFLPLALAGFAAARRVGGPRAGLAALVLLSIAFYGVWEPRFLPLLAGSVVFNYLVASALRGRGDWRERAWLSVAIAVNLVLLGWFKYAGFVAETAGWTAPNIALPLAISFFTFQQIAYQVERFRGDIARHDPLEYAAFVTFFPQLLAGPIVLHREMLPQFRERLRVSAGNLALGLSWFVVGLFKKVAVADRLGELVSPVYRAAESGAALSLVESWGGALAYTGQIYFDFSGYTDMALGLAAIFGIRLPFNFNSPYKATNIAEFWRRWHMTLGRFFRHYLYFPLGGNRRGVGRQYANLLVVFALVGLWHGAGWNFVIWGTLHGVFVVVQHAYGRWVVPRCRWLAGHAVAYGALTLAAVTAARTFFRAPSLDGALGMLSGMFGLSGRAWAGSGSYETGGTWLVLGCLLWCVLAPNSQEIFGQVEGRRPRWGWRANWKWALLLAAMAVWSVLQLREVTEFIYYRF